MKPRISLNHTQESSYPIAAGRENSGGRIALFVLPAILIIASIACSVSIPTLAPSPPDRTEEPVVSPPGSSPLPQSDITFRVEIPANSPPGQSLSLNVLDEVSGLAFSTKSYPMQVEDERHFYLTLPFPIGTVVKYRYSRQGSTAPVEEHISDGRQLRYRLYHAEGPGVVQDFVSRWTDTQFMGSPGRISGTALDAVTGYPIPNLLVVAGGSQTLTASDGSYLLEGLPPGLHNLVALSVNGSYRVFQQGAVVAADSTTPAELRLMPAPVVDITFHVTVPNGTIPAVPIRLAGNLYQLGNTFADLAGGVNTLAARMPVLNLQPEGDYKITLPLPVGSHIRYFYTLGDGFWNAELTAGGERHYREIVVPDSDFEYNDVIESWSSGNSAPITFDVTVPANTPQGDYVSIQFKPLFGWTEPIPMWRLGENRWAYVLLSPLNIVGNISYRYCRNDQCGFADDVNTAGVGNAGYPVGSGLFSQTIVDQVDAWSWLQAYPPNASPDFQVIPRGQGFIAGVELQAAYHPSWLARTNQAVDEVKKLGANWIVISPTWTFTRNSPPILELVPGRDALWYDVNLTLTAAREGGLPTALMPTPRFPGRIADWWLAGKRDVSWWVVWFERYRNFALHHADLAAQSGSQMIVLGGDWISPALPAGRLADGSPSGVLEDAESRWRNLLQEVRIRYNGQLAWALSMDQIKAGPPAFLDAVDVIYLEFSTPLAEHNSPSQNEILENAAGLLDSHAFPLYQQFSKPLVVALAYPSIDGAVTGCLPDPSDARCLEFAQLAQSVPPYPNLSTDLAEQVDIYTAMLTAVNQRDWIRGFVSRGYYPAAALQDASWSIHGKPAEEILKYWYLRILNNP